MSKFSEDLETKKVSRKSFLKGLAAFGIGGLAAIANAPSVLAATTIPTTTIESKGVFNLDRKGDGSNEVIFDSYDLDQLKAQLDASGGYVRATSAPTNTKFLWQDMSDQNIVKYHDGSAWKHIPSVWS